MNLNLFKGMSPISQALFLAQSDYLEGLRTRNVSYFIRAGVHIGSAEAKFEMMVHECFYINFGGIRDLLHGMKYELYARAGELCEKGVIMDVNWTLFQKMDRRGKLYDITPKEFARVLQNAIGYIPTGEEAKAFELYKKDDYPDYEWCFGGYYSWARFCRIACYHCEADILLTSHGVWVSEADGEFESYILTLRPTDRWPDSKKALEDVMEFLEEYHD